jgi:hypothetical protein
LAVEEEQTPSDAWPFTFEKSSKLIPIKALARLRRYDPVHFARILQQFRPRRSKALRLEFTLS